MTGPLDGYATYARLAPASLVAAPALSMVVATDWVAASTLPAIGTSLFLFAGLIVVVETAVRRLGKAKEQQLFAL